MKLFIKIAGVIIGIILVGFIAIQFIPVNRTNPPVAQEPNWDSPQTRALAERACFDCHSNETKWPWYSKVAPVSWIVADHVHEGRAALNLSEWSVTAGELNEAHGEEEENEGTERGEGETGEGREQNEVEEITEVIEEGEMPLWQYLVIHPEASLTPNETKALITGLQVTFNQTAQQGISQATTLHN